MIKKLIAIIWVSGIAAGSAHALSVIHAQPERMVHPIKTEVPLKGKVYNDLPPAKPLPIYNTPVINYV